MLYKKMIVLSFWKKQIIYTVQIFNASIRKLSKDLFNLIRMFKKIKMKKIAKRKLGQVKNRKNPTKWKQPTIEEKPITTINSKHTVKKT